MLIGELGLCPNQSLVTRFARAGGLAPNSVSDLLTSSTIGLRWLHGTLATALKNCTCLDIYSSHRLRTINQLQSTLGGGSPILSRRDPVTLLILTRISLKTSIMATIGSGALYLPGHRYLEIFETALCESQRIPMQSQTHGPNGRTDMFIKANYFSFNTPPTRENLRIYLRVRVNS